MAKIGAGESQISQPSSRLFGLCGVGMVGFGTDRTGRGESTLVIGSSMPCSSQKVPPTSTSVSIGGAERGCMVDGRVEEVVLLLAGPVPLCFDGEREPLDSWFKRELTPLIPSSPTVAWRMSSKKVHSPSLMPVAICLLVRTNASRGVPLEPNKSSLEPAAEDPMSEVVAALPSTPALIG